MKTAKKIFKIVGIILGIIILALIGYIIYLFASYHRIEDNLPQGAGELVASYDPDFALIEEVDLNSTRSYHVNEYTILKECLADYDTVFAQNYDSAFLFYPFTQPHGKSRSGLALFSRYPVTDSLRRRFPVSTSFSKFFDLDRCYSISRVPVDNGKEFVIFELHMSAYGNSDAIREGQIRMLAEDMQK